MKVCGTVVRSALAQTIVVTEARTSRPSFSGPEWAVTATSVILMAPREHHPVLLARGLP